MIAGFGKQSLLVGSAPHCDIRLGGVSVSPEHARLTHEGLGKITFSDLGHGRAASTAVRSRPARKRRSISDDQFMIGSAAVPNAHPQSLRS